MTLTETVRTAVIAMRQDGEAIRPFAARLGVPHMTLHRFLSGASVDSDTLDRLAAIGSPSTGDDRLREAAQAMADHMDGKHDNAVDYCTANATHLPPLRAALSTGAPDTEPWPDHADMSVDEV